MAVQAFLFGRLCGSLVSGSHGSLAARPLMRLLSASNVIGVSERPRAIGSPASTSGLNRLLSSSAGPKWAAADTREAWQPGQADTETSGPAGGGPPGVKDQGTTEMDEVFDILEGMGLQPGRHCVVGDGLAEVEVGLYLDGVKVALNMEATRPSHTIASDPKSYAMKRAASSVLQAHGWHPCTLVASDWHKLDGEQKTNYLAHCINHALSAGHGGHTHQHQHGGSCGSGCSDSSHKH